MAFRTFHNEEYYADPGVDILNQGLQRAADNISNLFSGISAAQQDKKRADSQFKYDQEKGSFESDTDLLNKMTVNIKDQAVNDIRKSGKISVETQRMMDEARYRSNVSKNQFDEAQKISGEIDKRAIRDKYYNPQADFDDLDKATSYEHNFYNRGEHLDKVKQGIGGLKSFRYDQYRADYVKQKGDQYKQNDFGTDRVTKSRYDQATFWDEAGKPGVTDTHAIDYIKSEPRVDQFFTERVNNQLDDEISKMRASGDERTAWMKGMKDDEVKAKLIDDPTLNLVNSQDFGVRKRILAKEDLAKSDRINTKVSVEYKAEKKSGSPGSNENIVQSYSFVNSQVQGQKAGSDAITPVVNAGPGGVIMQKNGKPILFSSNTPWRTNVNTGITDKTKIGSVPFNLTNYQLQAFKSTGAPFAIQGNTYDEQLARIKELPLEYFDPNGKQKLKPTMSIALNGFTVNQANLLNAANNDLVTIQDQIAQAEADGDQAKAARLQMAVAKIQGVRSMVGSGIDDQELMLAASRAGIRGVQVNEIVEAGDQDLASLNAITGGFNLRDRNNWSGEMKSLASAYEDRAKEAAAAGYKSTSVKSNGKKKPIKDSSIPTWTNQADYDKLPSGSEFFGPDGKKYRKE
jgi:hypothetical protein